MTDFTKKIRYFFFSLKLRKIMIILLMFNKIRIDGFLIYINNIMLFKQHIIFMFKKLFFIFFHPMLK